MSRKFDIFEVLKQVDLGNVPYYTDLDADDKKAIPLFVVARWMSGCHDKFQVMYLNECVNPYAFSVGTRHPDLMWMLMCAGCSGKARRYKWLKLPTSAANTTSVKATSEQVLKTMYHYSTTEARSTLSLLTYDDVCDLADHLGYPQTELDTIAKEWGVRVKRARTAKQPTTPAVVGFDPMSAFEM